MFLTDCDGCLTDGGMYYDEGDNEFKKFNFKDGMAFEMLRNHGVLTGIVTGETTNIVQRRANKLKVDEFHQGIKNKKEVIEEIIKKRKLDISEVAYVGDDINDLEAIKSCGISFAPQDAVKTVKENAKVVLSKNGGCGAIREAVEFLIDNNLI